VTVPGYSLVDRRIRWEVTGESLALGEYMPSKFGSLPVRPIDLVLGWIFQNVEATRKVGSRGGRKRIADECYWEMWVVSYWRGRGVALPLMNAATRQPTWAPTMAVDPNYNDRFTLGLGWMRNYMAEATMISYRKRGYYAFMPFSEKAKRNVATWLAAANPGGPGMPAGHLPSSSHRPNGLPATRKRVIVLNVTRGADGRLTLTSRQKNRDA